MQLCITLIANTIVRVLVEAQVNRATASGATTPATVSAMAILSTMRVAARRIKPLTCEFDVSESVSLNKDGAIANVQWDFHHQAGKFISTQGYTFLRDKTTKRAVLVVKYTFPKAGTHTVACSVQDDQGGERAVIQVIEVR